MDLKARQNFGLCWIKVLHYLEQFVPGTKRSILSYGSFRKDRSYVMMRSHFLTVLHIHSPFQTYSKATAFREFLQLRHLFDVERKNFFFLFSLIIYRRNFTSQSIVIDKIFVEIFFLNFFNRFKFHKIERWIVNVSIIEYLHTTISVSGPTIFCHLALMAARIWGVSSLDGSLSNASTLAASSNSSDDLSRSPSWRIALSTVVCDSPSGSISVVVSPSCNGIFYTHCHWIKIRCIKNIVKKYWI